MFNLMNGSFYDIIIRSDTIPFLAATVSVDCSEMVYNLTLLPFPPHISEISDIDVISHQHSVLVLQISRQKQVNTYIKRKK